MKKTSILFIGNSFTFFNDMPFSIFEKICCHANVEVSVSSITCGGYKLVQFADLENEYGKKVHDSFANNSYDIVILQEQSRNAIINYDEFFEGSSQLCKLSKNNGAQVYFYQTWGYKEGYSLLPTCAETTGEMATKIRAAYEKASSALNCKNAPVGTAFSIVHENSDINLYNPDLFHPSLYGSILAAWVIFSSIFNISPLEINYDCGINEKESIILKEAAYKAVFK